MRAPDQAHSSNESITTAELPPGTLPRLFVLIVATMSLLLVWRPSVVHGQTAATNQAAPTQTSDKTSATRTHVVRPSETLWSIAAKYYGDGHAWRELARRNKITVEGNKAPISVGQSLTVPAKPTVTGPKAAAVAAAPADSTVPRAVVARAGEGAPPSQQSTPRTTTGSLAAQTAGLASAAPASGVAGNARAPREPVREPVRDSARATARQAIKPSSDSIRVASRDTSRADLSPQRGTFLGSPSVTRVGLLSAEERLASRHSTESPTIFHRDIPDAAEAERRALAAMRPNTPAPRQGELDAAPYLVASKVAPVGATLVGRVDDTTVDPDASLSIATRVAITPAAGVRPAVGDRLQAVTTTLLAGGTQHIVIPTGIVEIVSVDGNKVIGVVRRVSGRMAAGQRLLAPPPVAPARVDAVALATADAATRITWLDTTETMPTIGSFVVLAAGSAQGVHAGDEFALNTAGERTTAVARVRIVRVDATGATAVVVKQFASGIAIGLPAQRVRRAP